MLRVTELLLLFELLCVSPLISNAIPYMLLTNSRAKCVMIPGNRDTTYTIAYHCPDLITMAEDADDTEETKEEEMEDPNIPEDQRSKRYAERYKKKMEAMKKKGKTMKDMNIILKQMPSDSETRDAEYYRRRSQRKMNTKTLGGRVRTEIHQKHGNLTYGTSDSDGAVEICVQSMSAKPDNPSRFSLKVKSEATITTEEEALQESVDEANALISRMRSDLQGIDRKLKNVVIEADKAKLQEISFHSKSVAMSKSTLYWPAIHIVVLLITGYLQASMMVKFFKKHHIM